MTCPADTTVNCTPDIGTVDCLADYALGAASTGSDVTGNPSATDNCDTEMDFGFSDSVEGGSCPQEEVITRTWTATDDCGNNSSCDQVVTVIEDEAPAITCPADTTVN